MARFAGKVGYGTAEESPVGSGNYIQQITERDHFGDIIRASRQLESGDKVNNDISVGNSISIVADDFAVDNFLKIKYVIWAGVYWIVTNVEVRHPRLILTLGGVYNGRKAS